MRGKRLRECGITFPLMGQTEQDFWMLPGKERMVLIAAYFVDREKVTEELGPNRGKWVNRFLRWIGLGPGYAWCGAFVSACAELAEYKVGPVGGRGRVYNWMVWGKLSHRLGFTPKRGDLCFIVNERTRLGHIGIVIGLTANGRYVKTIEGNTDGEGSREGDGAWRKERAVKSWRFIRMP